ncbi:MAG: peptidylprolyl isomerase [Gammaproteobacteria bacterium]
MTGQFITQNKVVTFIYTIEDEAGLILEQSDLPISYVHGGKHDLFEKIEHELEGAVVSDTIAVLLTPDEAFGAHDPDLTFTDDIENVPMEFRHVGAEVEMMNDKGDSRQFVVTRIENGKLTVDGNHPMAGKVITFNIKVTDIRDATPEEITNGVEPMAMPVLH